MDTVVNSYWNYPDFQFYLNIVQNDYGSVEKIFTSIHLNQTNQDYYLFDCHSTFKDYTQEPTFLFNNIISYGYDDEEIHEIDIEIELRSERLIIILSDDGIQFNPFKKDPPDTMLTVEERMIGGLGIHLVKKLMDECEYKRQTNNNIITLIKHNINI